MAYNAEQASKNLKEADIQYSTIYVVNISVIKGIGLPQQALMVQLTCGTESEHREFNTDLVNNTSDDNAWHCWNAHTKFQFYQQPKQLTFRVMDTAESLGEYTHALDALFASAAQTSASSFAGNIKLDGTADVRGAELELRLECTALRPLALMQNAARWMNTLLQNQKKLQLLPQEREAAVRQQEQLQQELDAYQHDVEQTAKEFQDLQTEYNTVLDQGTKLDEELNTVKQEYVSLGGIVEEPSTLMVAGDDREDMYGRGTMVVHDDTDDTGDTDADTSADADVAVADNIDVDAAVNAFVTFLRTRKNSDIENDRQNEADIAYNMSQISEAMLQSYKQNLPLVRDLQPQAATATEDDDDEKACAAVASTGDDRSFLQQSQQNADAYLTALQRFRNDINEHLQLSKERDINSAEFAHKTTDEIKFYSECYIAVGKLFFNASIIASTLKLFGEEIKEKFRIKKLKKITFNDLMGNDFQTMGNTSTSTSSSSTHEAQRQGQEAAAADGTNRPGIWKYIFHQSSDLDFVMFEMRDVMTTFLRRESIMQICRNARLLLTHKCGAYYPQFGRELGQCLLRRVQADEVNVVNVATFSRAAMNGFVLLLKDKKCFPVRLNESVTFYDAQSIDAHVYERTLAMFIVVVVKLQEYVADNIVLDENDKQRIAEQKKLVLAYCGELQLDDKSTKLCAAFFKSFFGKKKGVDCCGCCKEEEETGVRAVFRKMFGGMCG